MKSAALAHSTGLSSMSQKPVVGPPAAELARTVLSKASISCIESIGPSLETGDSFLTIKNSQGETVGTFRSSAVDGWWIEEEIDLASRLNAARGRLAKLGSGSAGDS
jgi:hypothetical protein